MTVGERIKKTRKVLSLTQQALAIKLGSTQNSIARYETDRVSPSSAVLTLICREFNVNEAWLRTGEGEMFNPAPEDDWAAYMTQLGLNEQMQSLISAYLKLPPENQKAVDKFIDILRQSPAASPQQVQRH